MIAWEETFTAHNLETHLPTRRVGRTVLLYDEVDSTNDLLKPITRDRTYDGLVVFARHQRRGRGREGRSWIARSGTSVLCSSLIFLPGRLAELAGPVALASAVAMGQAIAAAFHLPVKIKWPNDVYLESRKLAGLLIESVQVDARTAAFIIGIGINVTQRPEDFPPELRAVAGSVAQGLDRPVEEQERLGLARELMVRLDTHLDRVAEAEFDVLRHDWLDLAGGSDRCVVVNRRDQTFNARIIDIDHRDNSLLVQDPEGVILHLHQNTARIIG
jgi:BirA family transcriptional regulator, biotin operon repressor / biotin---[acetyl-CoA-carboxylase] ligase